jgi:hypothetical protein
MEQYDTKELDKLKLEILAGLNVLKTNNPMFSGKIDGHIKTLEGIQTNLICDGNKLSAEVQNKLNDAKEDLKLKQLLKDPENKIDGMVSKISFIENFCSTVGKDITSAGSTQQVVGQQVVGQQVVGQQEKPTRYSKVACKTGTSQDCALSLQQKMNDECKPDILNATLVNFPKARTGEPGNFKLKEDKNLGSGTKAVIAACNLPKVGATPATPTPQSSVLNPTIPVGGILTNNDIMTLMQQ